MAKSLREIVESMLFAGMKPETSVSPRQSLRWLGPLREPLERFLNAHVPDDPLYLSNRTWQQRARIWLVVALPCLLVASLVALSLLGFFRKRDPVAHELTPAQMAAQILPRDLDRSIQLHVERELDVDEARVDNSGPPKLVGTVRNRTDKTFAHAEVVFDLTDVTGSRLGAVAAQFEHIPPRGTVPFQVRLEQTNAAKAFVRDVNTQ